ncbi:MAG: hypothetical protein P1P90_03725 [Patescibacteria group bacterium]|nr:hypothetical protein [Patescibacteria group bacterium]
MSKTYTIENFDDLISEMNDALTDEQLAPLAREADIGIANFRTFFLEFVVYHLSNACGVNVNDLKSGNHMTTASYMDPFSHSLKTLLSHYEFPKHVEMKIAEFCSRVLLPMLAGLISEDLKIEVLGELGADAQKTQEN